MSEHVKDEIRERFRNSLKLLLDELQTDPEVSLVQFFGSAQRNQPTEHSDLDLYVITDRREFWRASREVAGVEVQTNFCPLHVLHKRLTTYNALALQAFAMGETLWDRDRKGPELLTLARRLYQQGPPPLKPVVLDTQRAMLTRIIQKLHRLPGDSPEARFQAGDGVQRGVTLFYQHQRLWIRGLQHCVSDMRERDSRIADLLVRYLQEGQPALAIAFLDAVLAPMGGHLLTFESERTPC